MKYVAYYRVSTKRQARSGLGLESQQQMVNDFLEDQDELVGQFVETSSGRRDDRVELGRAMAMAKRVGATLIIAKLDRFSRRVSFIAGMMESGIPLVVADMPNATDFQLHIFAALAQEERRMISTRTKLALAQAKARGVQLGRHGKVRAALNKQQADDFRATILEHLPEDAVHWSYSEVARHLNRSGLRTWRGGRFYPQTVKNYLARSVGASPARTE